MENDLQQWTVLTAQGRIKSDLGAYVEIQPRSAFTYGGVDRVVYRGAVTWNLGAGVTGWVGYGRVGVFRPTTFWEDRAWQQIQHEARLSTGDLGTLFIHRLRFEQRVFEAISGVAFRIRYFVRAFIPLESTRTWAAAVSNEIMFGLNTVIAATPTGFDQNRAFIGASYTASPLLRFETGYMNNYVRRPSSAEDKINHAWLFQAHATFGPIWD
jgi:hypothetical protein